MTGQADPGPRDADDVSLSFERVVFFSDAVFAIVITLLVLPLTAEIELPEGVSLASHLRGTWPQVLTFVITFLVIGQFWIAHHRLYDRLRRHDQGLLWMNPGLPSHRRVHALPGRPARGRVVDR